MPGLGAPPTTASAFAAHPQSSCGDQPPVEHSAPAVSATAADHDNHTTGVGANGQCCSSAAADCCVGVTCYDGTAGQGM